MVFFPFTSSSNSFFFLTLFPQLSKNGSRNEDINIVGLYEREKEEVRTKETVTGFSPKHFISWKPTINVGYV